ncbi:polysaccharide biosynthesis protein [Candidatus Saccharibacteria bacterium]|nr:polysaccharide biosynthesis protein [Candidatus Saccharibacteria bacterium]
MSKHKKAPVGLLNTFSSLLLQVVTIINGFIIPRLILSHFGSETNGLVSSLNQFLNYVSLLEGGLNSVIMASLYKPLAKKDNEKVSSIITTSTRFFRRISYIFIGYAVILAFVYPALSNSSFDYGFIASLTMILGIKLFSQYCFSLSYKNLLYASKHGYIINFSQILLIVLDVISALIVVNVFPSIHLFKFCSAVVFILQPIIYSYYVKKHFNLDKKAKPDNKLIASRWDGLSINIAYFIHSNTDVTLLTIFTRLETVSVYGVYGLVTAGLRNLVNSIAAGIAPSLGDLYARGDEKEINQKFDLFEYITFAVTFSLFTIGGLLITPFVMIYTHNITDVSYFEPLFGVLFLLGEAIYVVRSPYVRLAYAAGKFKDMTRQAFTEAGMNIIISIILVQYIGLVGVAIGTLVAMTYRTLFQVWYLRDHLINRPFMKFLRRFAAFAIPTILGVLLCVFVWPVTEYTIKNWLIHAAIYIAVFAVIYGAVSYFFFHNDLRTLKAYLKHRH